MKLELSWPPYILWPNSRAHWKAQAPHKRAMRDEAYVLARNALNGGEWQASGVIVLTVTGHKPAERGQDIDGLTSALKASFDGIASALKVNDRNFRPVVVWGEPLPPRGGVTVEIAP